MATKEAVYELSEYKAAPDGEPGEFTALVSVFGNVDLVGDRVMPGAFKGSIGRWQAKGDPIPVVWSHDSQNPYAHIGSVDPSNAVETSKGLVVTGKLDIEDNPFAAQVHQLLVKRRVTGFSFRYDVINEKRARDGANELLELDLTEVGPTLKGANPDAQLINAKALLDEAAEAATAEYLPGEDAKAGRRLSTATEKELTSIRDTVADLAARLESLLGTAEEMPKAADAPERDAEEIEPADDTKSDDQEPMARSSFDAETLQLRSLIEEMSATPKE